MSELNNTLHETMEIHELLNLKTICITKSKMLQGIVFDQELKALLNKDLQQSVSSVKTLQELLIKTQPQLNGGIQNGFQ